MNAASSYILPDSFRAMAQRTVICQKETSVNETYMTQKCFVGSVDKFLMNFNTDVASENGDIFKISQCRHVKNVLACVFFGGFPPSAYHLKGS